MMILPILSLFAACNEKENPDSEDGAIDPPTDKNDANGQTDGNTEETAVRDEGFPEGTGFMRLEEKGWINVADV